MTRLRAFTIVFHNVKHGAKPCVNEWAQAQSPTQLLVALEPYPQGEGFHIHVFMSFKNPREFKVILKKAQDLSATIIEPRPEGEERDWGRVQVDRMRGTFQEATAYLTNPEKDKICDTSVIKFKKGVLKCDVCDCYGTAMDFGADYPDGKTGRCRKCICIPHRYLRHLGFEVRDLTNFLI